MRRTTRPLAFLSLILCVAAGCASGRPVASGTTTDPELITRDQIQELRVSTAYDAVQNLRGNWLTERGTESFRYPMEVQVYLDDVHMGGLSMLRNIATPTIQYIRHFRGLEASARWGLDHGRGVIYVSTKAVPP